MAGYERSRIVGMSEKNLDEFTCGICHELFNEPVVTQCCRQTYCKSCIEEWLNKVNTCPNDRKPMRVNDLSPLPRFVVNLWNNMKIKCEYQEKGCDVITTIGELTKHLDECEHKPNKNCKTCGLLIDVGEEHNCIANLVIKNNSITDEMKRLQREVQSLIKQLNNTAMGMADVIKSARAQINNYVVEDPLFRVSLAQKQVLIEKCKQVILNKDSYEDISSTLNNQINNLATFQSDKFWNVNAFSIEGGESLVISHQYFRIRFDKVIIEIFTAADKND